MSYSTFDKPNDMSTTYAHTRGGGLGGSMRLRNHPADCIFERMFPPKANPSGPLTEPLARQLRNPQPAVNFNFVDRKLAAHAVTERQASLRRLDLRQKRVDSWLGDAPIRMSSAYLTDNDNQKSLMRSASEPSVDDVTLSSLHASSVSRDVYQKHGYLVGRSQGSIADGRTGEAPRRHNPLSFHAMRFSGDLQESRSGSRRKGPLKPSKQWRTTPESGFVFDPRTFLPVPRGGWDSHPLALNDWPDAAPAGSRHFAAPDPLRVPASVSSGVFDPTPVSSA